MSPTNATSPTVEAEAAAVVSQAFTHNVARLVADVTFADLPSFANSRAEQRQRKKLPSAAAGVDL